MGAIFERSHCPELRRGCVSECSMGIMGISLFSTSYGKKQWGGREPLRAGLNAIGFPLPSSTEPPPDPASYLRAV